MDGKIRVKSEVGRGSTFSFQSALKPGNAEKIQTRQSPELDIQTDQPLKILLAEDNPVNVKVTTKLLTLMGHMPVAAPDGKKVLEHLADEYFDLVLMDIEMPEMDGLEATRRIRNGDAGHLNRGIPIIAMTAHTLGDIREKCEDSGMNDVISKPAEFYELHSIIMKNIPESQAIIPESAKRRQMLVREDTILDRKGALCRFSGDEAFLMEVYKLFPQEASGILGKLREAANRYQMKEVAMQAHKFKGTCGAVGAESCQNYAARLEQVAKEEKTEQIGPLFERLEQAFEEVCALISKL